MSLLVCDRVACAAPDGTPLFENLTFAIDRQVTGLVGRNGAGKSTLLRAILGEVPLAAGTITRGGTIGVLAQLPAHGGGTLATALGIAGDLAVLARIESGAGSEADLAAADWTLPARIETALATVGLPALDPERPLASLSGGEQTRLRLAGTLLHEPDLLLLDEPTNNLDDAGRAAVAALLATWKGGALVASHDRELLGGVERIVELTRVGVHVVTGGWELFDALRQAERARAAEELERSRARLGAAQREKQREAEKQDRRDKRGRAVAAKDIDPRVFLHRQQQRAEKTAARYRGVGDEQVARAADALDAARAHVEQVTPIAIALPPSGLAGRQRLLEAHAITCTRGGRRLFGPLDLAITGPERIALIGPNGSGKTSLIRMILGQEPPDAGTIHADAARIAVFDQHLALLGGAAGRSLADVVRGENPGLGEHGVRQALAAYGFRNRWAEREVASLSGGERVRLALAAVFSRAQPPQLLILDEPTNHLDLAATELLEKAIAGFDGAVLCVSHDAAFRAGLGLSREIALGSSAG